MEVPGACFRIFFIFQIILFQDDVILPIIKHDLRSWMSVSSGPLPWALGSSVLQSGTGRANGQLKLRILTPPTTPLVLFYSHRMMQKLS